MYLSGHTVLSDGRIGRGPGTGFGTAGICRPQFAHARRFPAHVTVGPRLARRADDGAGAVGRRGVRLRAGGDLLPAVPPRCAGGGLRLRRGPGGRQRRRGRGLAQCADAAQHPAAAGGRPAAGRARRDRLGVRLHLRPRHGDVGGDLHPAAGGRDQVRPAGCAGDDGDGDGRVHGPGAVRRGGVLDAVPGDFRVVSHGDRDDHRSGGRRDGVEPDARPRRAGARQGGRRARRR